ncbi:MAG: hypothetical protein NTY86_14600 [Deltaproteobacteria bacterium]|nr:hypothetical protein [Deltaproteobacteria bacterium]
MNDDLRQAGAGDLPETVILDLKRAVKVLNRAVMVKKRRQKNCLAIVLDGSGESPYTTPVFMLYHSSVYHKGCFIPERHGW